MHESFGECATGARSKCTLELGSLPPNGSTLSYLAVNCEPKTLHLPLTQVPALQEFAVKENERKAREAIADLVAFESCLAVVCDFRPWAVGRQHRNQRAPLQAVFVYKGRPERTSVGVSADMACSRHFFTWRAHLGTKLLGSKPRRTPFPTTQHDLPRPTIAHYTIHCLPLPTATSNHDQRTTATTAPATTTPPATTTYHYHHSSNQKRSGVGRSDGRPDALSDTTSARWAREVGGVAERAKSLKVLSRHD